MRRALAEIDAAMKRPAASNKMRKPACNRLPEAFQARAGVVRKSQPEGEPEPDLDSNDKSSLGKSSQTLSASLVFVDQHKPATCPMLRLELEGWCCCCSGS